MKILSVLCIAAIVESASAQQPSIATLQKENAELRQRVDRLENDLAQLRSLLGAKPLPAAPAPVPDKKPVTAGLDLQLYGYVKLDAAYDDSRVSVGNFARWVESEGMLDNDNHFNMTANQTRLGLNIAGPMLNGVATTGKVEIDFYGAGAGENKPDPMLRHAYVNFAYPDWQFSVLAGQASDIISPLFPNTVNYSVGWWQGNIGYRRPQIRLTKDFNFSERTQLRLEAGPTRTITGRRYVFKAATDPDTGADAGFPTMQGRASVSLPVGGKRQATLGVSGHWGREEVHEPALTGEQEFDTWSVNVDVRVPVTDWLLLQAEGFVGRNLDSFLGGIGQGFDTNRMDGIDAIGGWVAVTITPTPKWQLNLGAGVDDVEDKDVTNAADRTNNYFVFGNAYYFITPNLQLGLEASYLRTCYRGMDNGDAWREQLAVIYKF